MSPASFWFSAFAGPQGHVVAFEPQFKLHDYLAGMKFKCRWDNVTLERIALSDTSGTADLFIPGNAVSEGSSPGASIALGVLLMGTHRLYARPFARRRAARRCLWCGGPVDGGVEVAVAEPGGTVSWRACGPESRARRLRPSSPRSSRPCPRRRPEVGPSNSSRLRTRWSAISNRCC